MDVLILYWSMAINTSVTENPDIALQHDKKHANQVYCQERFEIKLTFFNIIFVSKLTLVSSNYFILLLNQIVLYFLSKNKKVSSTKIKGDKHIWQSRVLLLQLLECKFFWKGSISYCNLVANTFLSSLQVVLAFLFKPVSSPVLPQVSGKTHHHPFLLWLDCFKLIGWQQ